MNTQDGAMYDYCLLRWKTGAWTEVQLTRAVTKGYITEAEKAEIMTYPQNPYAAE